MWLQGKEQGKEQEKNSADAILRIADVWNNEFVRKLQRSFHPICVSIW